MKIVITISLICGGMLVSASADTIIVSDTTLGSRIGQPNLDTVHIYDGPVSPTTVEIVDGAHITPNIYVHGQSVLNMRGGITESFIFGLDNSTINIFGGQVATGEDVEMNDDSVANIYGGHFGDDIEATDRATVHLYGGTFEKANDGAFLGVQRDGVIHVYLIDYEIRPATNAFPTPSLVGRLSDGSKIDVGLFVDSFELRDAQIVLHRIIPEPNSLVLALIAMASLLTVSRRTVRAGWRRR